MYFMMKSKQKSFVAGVLAAGMFLSSAMFVSAESTASSSNVEALARQVQQLLAQIQTLQVKLDATKKETVSVKQELALTRALAFGSKGKDVSELQEFLKTYTDIYPEGLVTGYYGRSTENAVKRLQEKHGLEKAGVVGPKTRAKLKTLFLEHEGKGKGLKCDDGRCMSASLNLTGAATTTGTNGVDKVTICHKPEKKHSGETITIASPALSAHLAHGDTLGACGGRTATTTPDTTAPVISGLTASGITATSTTILWNTNESADGTVWYSTANPVDTASMASTSIMTNATLSLTHNFPLTGLTASTTYYYLASSKDAIGNRATSSQASFLTL
jgi:hypothetical protein